jgi:hypothetical protein
VGQSRWISPGAAPPPGPEPALARDTAVLTLYADDGAVQDTLDVIPGREAVQSIRVTEQSVSVMKRSPVFGRANVFAAHAEGVWSSTNDRFELRLRDVESGRLVRIVRAPGLERASTEATAQEVYARALSAARTPDERRWTEEWYAHSPRPGTAPAYDRIVVDDRGRLWVRAWAAPDPGGRWWVFASSGELLGAVAVPGGMTLTAVRGCDAWGVERDRLDVSYVVRYTLRGADVCG